MPVSVATVEQRAAPTWDEFSGRLEAVERVEVRPRVAGVIEAVHFREGALVKQGDLLFSIDPAPYAAEVERNKAQVLAIQARIAMTRNDLERGQQLWDSRTISQRDLDQRLNAQREAEANLRAAEAALTSAQLNLDYTSVKAPVAGRVGKIEVTVGNLVAAGPGSPVLTSLVSINPIYASFNADERAVMRALKSQPAGANGLVALDRIPVQMGTVLSDGTPFAGHLQLIDNQVDARSGTVRVRAVFDNADGKLMPGQFARVRMGHAESQRCGAGCEGDLRDAPGDQRLVAQRAATDHAVDVLADQIDRAVGDAEVDLDVGITGVEVRQGGDDHEDGERGADVDPQASLGVGLGQRHAAVELVEFAEQADDALIVGGAVGGHRDPPGGAVEQLGADMGLQALDQLGDGGFWDAHGFRGLAKGAGLDNPDEGAHGGELIHQ